MGRLWERIPWRILNGFGPEMGLRSDHHSKQKTSSLAHQTSALFCDIRPTLFPGFGASAVLPAHEWDYESAL